MSNAPWPRFAAGSTPARRELADAIAYRSRRELGHSGLAQRLGARTPEKLVQTLTGSSFREAQTFIRVGELIATPPADTAPANTLARGCRGRRHRGHPLPCGGRRHPRTVLAPPPRMSRPTTSAPPQPDCCATAPSLALEQLAADARNARAELDLNRVRDREAAMRDRRYLRFTPQLDGMTRVSGLLDPESAAHIVAAADAALAPRRGPRFVDPESVAAAEKLIADPRTNEQILVDTFVELTRIATPRPATRSSASSAPSCRSTSPTVTCANAQASATSTDNSTRSASRPSSATSATQDPCPSDSISTARPSTSDASSAPSPPDNASHSPHETADAESQLRLPTLLDRSPPHQPMVRRRQTDIADGILLCRFHHMMIHNNGWRIVREGADYYLIPPPTTDFTQEPIPDAHEEPHPEESTRCRSTAAQCRTDRFRTGRPTNTGH